MPLFMDRHSAVDVTPEQVADAHNLDVSVQDEFGVRYHSYWFNPDDHTVFCLAEGPDVESVVQVHKRAHGLMADKLIEVDPAMVEAMIGDVPGFPPGTAYTASAVRAILFTDMCSSTAATSRLGDDAAMELVHDHDEIVHRVLRDHGGRYVKHTGDGMMASFSSVAAAVHTAVAIHQALEERNRDAAEPLEIRVGISAGEPVSEGEDLYGSAVQLASRLCSWAPAGSIAVSGAVHDLCIGKQISFKDRRSVSLKGFPERQQVYEVDWRVPA